MPRRALVAGTTLAAVALVLSLVVAVRSSVALADGAACDEFGLGEVFPRRVRLSFWPPSATCTFPVIHGEVTWTEERWDVYLPGIPGAVLTAFWLTLRGREPADPSTRRRPTREPRRRRPAHRH